MGGSDGGHASRSRGAPPREADGWSGERRRDGRRAPRDAPGGRDVDPTRRGRCDRRHVAGRPDGRDGSRCRNARHHEVRDARRSSGGECRRDGRRVQPDGLRDDHCVRRWPGGGAVRHRCGCHGYHGCHDHRGRSDERVARRMTHASRATMARPVECPESRIRLEESRRHCGRCDVQPRREAYGPRSRRVRPNHEERGSDLRLDSSDLEKRQCRHRFAVRRHGRRTRVARHWGVGEGWDWQESPCNATKPAHRPRRCRRCRLSTPSKRMPSPPGSEKPTDSGQAASSATSWPATTR